MDVHLGHGIVILINAYNQVWLLLYDCAARLVQLSELGGDEAA